MINVKEVNSQMEYIYKVIEQLIKKDNAKQFAKKVAFYLSQATDEVISIEDFTSYLKSRTKLLTTLETSINNKTLRFAKEVHQIEESDYLMLAHEGIQVLERHVSKARNKQLSPEAKQYLFSSPD